MEYLFLPQTIGGHEDHIAGPVAGLGREQQPDQAQDAPTQAQAATAIGGGSE